MGVKKIHFRACLHEGGGPQVGEVTRGGLPHLTCKRDHIEMRDCMDRRVTRPKRVTLPTWGPPPPCKQALRPCLHGVGDPSLVGRFLLFCVPQSVKTKETNPTRPGFPTPCKQALKST